jgi:hypothetical protein
MIKEEDLNDFDLFEKVAKRVFSSNGNEVIEDFMDKMQFSFLSNNEGYRTLVLKKLGEITHELSIERISSVCSDSVVGNYFVLYALMKEFPVVDSGSVKKLVNFVTRLTKWKDVCCFGFPFEEQVIFQIDERVQSFSKEELDGLVFSLNFLFQIDFLKKTKDLVQSIQIVYQGVGKIEYSIRAKLIKTLLEGNQREFSVILEQFGNSTTKTEEDICTKYFEIWKLLENLTLPLYFDVNNLRYNGVVFNDNFYFLKYKNFEGKEKIVFPFGQVPLLLVNMVFDPFAKTYFTPKERYGRLNLKDIYSFKEIVNAEEPTPEAITKIKSMDEDEIDNRIRLILKDVNRTHHSPVEVVDILTQYLNVNNVDDIRWAGFITKGESFGCVHLNDIGGQILKACLSPIKIVLLIHIARIDDMAVKYFIEECESKQKNYCVVSSKEIAKLFMAYNVLEL